MSTLFFSMDLLLLKYVLSRFPQEAEPCGTSVIPVLLSHSLTCHVLVRPITSLPSIIILRE